MYEYDCDVSAQGDGGCRAQAVQLCSCRYRSGTSSLCRYSFLRATAVLHGGASAWFSRGRVAMDRIRVLCSHCVSPPLSAACVRGAVRDE